MHYQTVLIGTLTTVVFAAPAPLNFRQQSTTTTTTTTTATTPPTRIGVPEFSHIPIFIPGRPQQVNPNLRPAYTPHARPGTGAEPGRNPLFARSQQEDPVMLEKRDDPEAVVTAIRLAAEIHGQQQQNEKRDDPEAVVTAIRLAAEIREKQQQQQQNEKRDDPEDSALTELDDVEDAEHLNTRRGDVETSDLDFNALEFPLQRKEQRGVNVGADVGAASETVIRPLQQRGENPAAALINAGKALTGHARRGDAEASDSDDGFVEPVDDDEQW